MLGWLGFIYNGLVFSLGISIWRKLSRTTSYSFNSIASSITIALVVTCVRSQSMYFIKHLWLTFLPSFLLYWSATGIAPSFRNPLTRVKK